MLKSLTVAAAQTVLDASPALVGVELTIVKRIWIMAVRVAFVNMRIFSDAEGKMNLSITRTLLERFCQFPSPPA